MTLLGSFSPAHPTLTVSEGARIAATDKGTVSRILARLAKAGLLERASDGRSYHIGLGLLQLGELYLSANPIAKLATPRLASIARRTSCAIQLVVRDGPQCVVLASASAPGAPLPPVTAETRLPLHASAGGKVFLASLANDELQRLLDERQLISYTGRTLSSREALRDALRGIRQRGYAEADEEYFLGQHAVAVPVVDGSGVVEAALVAVSSQHLELDGRDSKVIERLRSASLRITLARGRVTESARVRRSVSRGRPLDE